MANTQRTERHDDDLMLVTDYGYEYKFSQHAQRVAALTRLIQESQAMGFYDLDKSNDSDEKSFYQPV